MYEDALPSIRLLLDSYFFTEHLDEVNEHDVLYFLRRLQQAILLSAAALCCALGLGACGSAGLRRSAY